MPNVYDLVQPAELIGVVRGLQFPELRLAQFFPRQNEAADQYAILRRLEDSTAAAPVRGWDAEAPIGARPGIARIQGELAPISRKFPLTEKDARQLRSLGASDAEIAQAIINEIFDDAARATAHIERRLEIMRGDLLMDGIVSINENDVQATIDYAVPAAHRVVAAASWAAAGTDILGHIRSWVDVYVATNGFRPGRILTSSRVIGFMQGNTGIREMLAVGAATPPLASTENINQVMNAFALPQLQDPYDLQLRNPAGTKARVIADDLFIMLPGEDVFLGETQYGITEEARNLVSRNLLPATDAPGVAVTRWATDDPVQTWTKGAAVALPVLYNPDALFIADTVP